MKKSVIGCLVMAISVATAGLVPTRQTPAYGDWSHVYSRVNPLGSSYSESMAGGELKVPPHALLQEMLFPLVLPPKQSSLKLKSTDWWTFQKTSKRPPFGVAKMSYTDSKFPGGVIVVLEWKHVSGVPTVDALMIPETFLIGRGEVNPLTAMKGETDVACYFEGIPLDRVREVTKWIPTDGKGGQAWGASTLHHGQLFLMQTRANHNARALATAVQGHAIQFNKYDDKLADYATDLGGSIPVNPCTGTETGYFIRVKGQTATVGAEEGSLCGKWTPSYFSLTL